MKQSHISIFIVLFLFLGCETVVDITIPVENPQLVINSTLIDDETIKVNLTESHHILKSGKYQGVIGATVDIYENDQLLTTLPDSSGGNYISAQFKAQKGKKYTVEVAKAGYNTARADVVLPFDTARVLNVQTDTITFDDFGYTATYARFKVELDDDPKTDNYYAISIYRGGYVERYDWTVNPPEYIDSVYSYTKVYIQTEDPNFEEYQSFGEEILFNDELFNGSSYQINLLTQTSWYNPDHTPDDSFTYFISLANTSESYYLYGLSSKLQYWTSDNPFAQPVTVYNNIENGFGVFGAYNTAVYKVE